MNHKYETPPASIRRPLSVSTSAPSSSNSSSVSVSSNSSRKRPELGRDGAFPISPRSTISRGHSRKLSSPIPIGRPPTPPMSPSHVFTASPVTTPSPMVFSPVVPIHTNMFSPPRQRSHRRSMSYSSAYTAVSDSNRTETVHTVFLQQHQNSIQEKREDPGDAWEREMNAKKLSFHTKEALAHIEIRNFKAAEPSIHAVLKLLPKTIPEEGTGADDTASQTATAVSGDDDDAGTQREKWLRHLLDAQSSQNRWTEVIPTLQELIAISSAEGGDGAKTAGLHYLLADAYFRSAASLLVSVKLKNSKQTKANLELADHHCRIAMKTAYGIPEMKGAWKDPLRLMARICSAKGDVADADFYRSLLKSEGFDFGLDDDMLDDRTFMKWIGADLISSRWLESSFAHMETADYVLLSIFVGLVGVFGFTVTKCYYS